MKIALGIEYNGSHFHGWQCQPNAITLQATLEGALSKIANEDISLACAGRTDAKVHATNQVVHFQTNSMRSMQAWIYGTNKYLPRSICIHWAKIVDPSFHARFSAVSRRYHYFIYNRPVRSSLFSGLTGYSHHYLDEQKMYLAARDLIGEHDFTSFRSANCQSKTPRRHIFAIDVFRYQELIIIDIVANSFLYHMVRNIVGVLIEIGSNKKDVEWCKTLLQAKDKGLVSSIASPDGLYLTGVRYADHYEIPCYFRRPIFYNCRI
jgi:tRNA pseudouridine38-40 synthase